MTFCASGAARGGAAAPVLALSYDPGGADPHLVPVLRQATFSQDLTQAGPIVSPGLALAASNIWSTAGLFNVSVIPPG